MQIQQVEEGKDDIGVAMPIGGVFQQGQFRFIAQHLVEHVDGVARGGSDGPAAKLGVLGTGRPYGYKMTVAKITGDGVGVANVATEKEALAIG